MQMQIYQVEGLFLQKSPIIRGSFAKRDLQLKASYVYLCHRVAIPHAVAVDADVLSCRAPSARVPHTYRALLRKGTNTHLQPYHMLQL